MKKALVILVCFMASFAVKANAKNSSVGHPCPVKHGIEKSFTYPTYIYALTYRDTLVSPGLYRILVSVVYYDPVGDHVSLSTMAYFNSNVTVSTSMGNFVFPAGTRDYYTPFTRTTHLTSGPDYTITTNPTSIGATAIHQVLMFYDF